MTTSTTATPTPPSSGANAAPSASPSFSASSAASPSADSTSASRTAEADRQSALQRLRWNAFEKYAEEKEHELWKAFCELDRDGDMRLGIGEMREACRRAGVEIKDPKAIEQFVRTVDRNGDGVISFDEWRDFLLLLPRPSTMKEIWRYYRTTHRPSMSRLTQDADVVVGGGKSSWNKLLSSPTSSSKPLPPASRPPPSLSSACLPDLRSSDRPPPDCAWASSLAREKAEREKEQLARQRAFQAHETADVHGSGTVSSATLKLEESGVTLASSPSSDASETAKAQRSKEQERIGSEDGRHDGQGDEEEEEDNEQLHEMFAGAGKFLLAGGMAGAVSRTATAPFDRLKVYLITSPSTCPPPSAAAAHSATGAKPPRPGAGSLVQAVKAVYTQGGGIKAFWTGNGLNIIKIFPESAIKFLSYESAKRVFAQYWDKVPDQTMISNSSRFVAGGIGGVVSQFCIYPIESLKTRVMSSSGSCSARGNALILQTARDMMSRGGLRFFFRGLPAGLIGVFPYSAIDMSTFEGIKLAYTKWAGEEPGIAGSLCFGAVSGGVGASSVYPLNLVRTRLQAQGTPAHPQTYTGIRDAALKCYQREGWRGFYKGLTPTLVKVVPAVAISYAVYDSSKKLLFQPEEPADSHTDGQEES
ncbi:hypothetical protein JCM10213v2_005952 [Rhodosporidiobolus nylandii]